MNLLQALQGAQHLALAGDAFQEADALKEAVAIAVAFDYINSIQIDQGLTDSADITEEELKAFSDIVEAVIKRNDQSNTD